MTRKIPAYVVWGAILVVLIGVFGIATFVIKSNRRLTIPYHLEYGLVWFGTKGASQNSQAGQSNDYFDPQKPTIIFIHGWMPDQVGEPPTYMVDFPGQGQDSTYTLDLAAPWVDAGWNIGIFYWHPFSDEEFVWDAEDKICNFEMYHYRFIWCTSLLDQLNFFLFYGLLLIGFSPWVRPGRLPW